MVKQSLSSILQKKNYESVIEINFVRDEKYKGIISDGYEAADIIKNISLIDPSKKFIPEKTLIFFDEITEFPEIATSLKFFCIDKRFDVICSGSMLGINYRKIESNSVGYKKDYEMFSLDFEEFLWAKGYDDTTVDDIIRLSETSKGSFYYYFNTKDELLNTLSIILDDNYEVLKTKMDPDMNCYEKLLYLNYEAHSMMEEKISIDLLASLYSTQLVAQGHRSLLDQNRTYYKLISSVIDEGQKRGEISDEVPVNELVRYYSMCERALVSDWCLNKGAYSLGEYSKQCMPIMLEHFKK